MNLGLADNDVADRHQHDNVTHNKINGRLQDALFERQTQGVSC